MTDPIQSAPFPDEEPDIIIGSNGPSCPHCGGTTSAVKDTRPYRTEGNQQYTKRRRMCGTCAHRFTTFEGTTTIMKLPPRVKMKLSDLHWELGQLLQIGALGDD